MKYLGITDVPCSKKNEDVLKIGKYVDGLEKFICNCPTPMAIALQGDWGTGKTSIINMLQTSMNEPEKNVKAIYFNTWQYSQFNMSESLYLSFLNNLAYKLENKDDIEKYGEKIAKTIFKIGKSISYELIKKTTDIDPNDFEKLFQQEIEKMQEIEGIKDNFKALVKNISKIYTKQNKEGRLVIFIDDLDRLNPEVAIELLEVIKLFLDVENCIFVLAIDYEVVVNGVRSKFGNVSDEKCKSYFDKIVQLPFRMPVELYSLNTMIQNTLSEHIENTHLNAVSEFVKKVIGSNPRTFKRLANSFFLIECVMESSIETKENSKKKRTNTLAFCSLCIQMSMPKLYSALISVNDSEELKNIMEKRDIDFSNDELRKIFLQDLNIMEDMSKDDCERYAQVIDNLGEVLLEVFNTKGLKESNYSEFLEVMSLTSITNVIESENKRKAESMKVNAIEVYGQRIEVRNPTEAVVETYQLLLKGKEKEMENPNFLDVHSRILTHEDRKDGYFRQKRNIMIFKDKPLYIGVSSSSEDKKKCVSILCKYFEENDGVVKWFYDNEIVYKN